MNHEGATVPTTAPTLDNLILNLSHEITVRATLDATFNAVRMPRIVTDEVS